MEKQLPEQVLLAKPHMVPSHQLNWEMISQEVEREYLYITEGQHQAQ
jgi:hypothetical protein